MYIYYIYIFVYNIQYINDVWFIPHFAPPQNNISMEVCDSDKHPVVLQHANWSVCIVILFGVCLFPHLLIDAV